MTAQPDTPPAETTAPPLTESRAQTTTCTPDETNERTLVEATVAFLTEHLGHRISTYSRRSGRRHYYTLAKIDPGSDCAFEPYERPWWLKGPDTCAYGPAYSIRHVFANADELTCAECHISRAWIDARTTALDALNALSVPYLNGAFTAFSHDEHLRNVLAMARLIATASHGGPSPSSAQTSARNPRRRTPAARDERTLTMTREPASAAPATVTASAEPPPGTIQRLAGELLDVLADELAEQPAEAGLTELLARYGQHAADAHQIPWNGWIREGLETAALLGLALSASDLPSHGPLPTREGLDGRFAATRDDERRAWLIGAAELLHRHNAEDSYGPPIGEDPTSQADNYEAIPGDHRNEQGLYVQLLPGCLTPRPSDHDAQPDLDLPHEGDPVVIARGHVMFLDPDHQATHLTRETSHLWGAPLLGEGCGAARWDPDSLTALDPAYAGRQDADTEALETAWTLLLDLANHRHTEGGVR